MSIELTTLRVYRNQLLMESDWTVASDSPLSDSKISEWKIYRQALRDISKTASPSVKGTPPELVMSSVTFTTKPS